MKSNFKNLLIIVLAISLFSCKKEDGGNTAPTSLDCKVSPFKIGTVYTYQRPSGNYTQTADYDSIINGKRYTHFENSQLTFQESFEYTDTITGNLWNYNTGFFDMPKTEMIMVKPGAANGTTWNYVFPSVYSPTTDSYKITHKVIDNAANITFNGKSYSAIKMQNIVDQIESGVVTLSTTNINYWVCGIGVFQIEQNGSIASTLTGYKY